MRRNGADEVQKGRDGMNRRREEEEEEIVSEGEGKPEFLSRTSL